MRPLWKGSISFGLINIPVRMLNATQEKELKFVMLHNKDQSEIRYARMCKVEDKEVPWSEIVKGYEYEKGKFVILDKSDFEKVNLKKTKTLEIVSFINEEEIDSIYYVKPYFLEPDKNADKAYNILREALEKTGKVGLAKFVFHEREHLAIVKSYNKMLIINVLRYQSELQAIEEVTPPATTKLNKQEVDLAIKLINHLTVEFKPEEYEDTYVEDLKEIIHKKAKGKPVHPKTKEAPPSKVTDIMSLLQASLEEKKRPRRKTA